MSKKTEKDNDAILEKLEGELQEAIEADDKRQVEEMVE